MVLPQAQPVVVPSGKVADVQANEGETLDLSDLSFGQEPIRDPSLIENLYGARVKTPGSRSG